MARKNKNLNRMTQDLHAEILMHAHALKFSDLDSYQTWCRANSFSVSLRKTPTQRKREVAAYRSKALESRLKKHKKEGNFRFQIDQIYHRQLKRREIQGDVFVEISKGFKHCPFPNSLYEVLIYLEEKTKFIEDVAYVKGIIGLVNHRSKWLRALEDWQPKTHNTGRQFSSLVRHLVAKYEVPEFMDRAWLQGHAIHQGWFIHIGAGNNIRSARSLPIELTKKMAHYFIGAPRHNSVLGAFRWAQVRANGGSEAIANAVNETRLARKFRDEAFWLSVLRFFIDNPMLDVAHINPIVDYIWNQKYENRIEFVERGVAREIAPAQPNFSMHGRTVETLLRQVDGWHRQLGRESRGGDLQWRKSPMSDYRFVEGNARRTNMKIWTIRELLSSKELIAEGRTQGHCVASYARSCFSGKTSIWTLDLSDSSGISKMVTIEVNLQSREISQIRGMRNRLPTSIEIDVVRRWAQKETLTLAGFIA